jgi:hypothetical protein
MKPFTLIQMVILFCCLFLLQCLNSTPIAGATDIPNETASVSAVIHDLAGTPVYRAAVTMVRAEYLSPLPQTTGGEKRGIFLTMTDDSGHFSVDSLDSGSYMIEVNDGSRSACRIHCAIGGDTGTKNLGVFAVQPYANIIGKIDTIGIPSTQRYVQIYGLNRIFPIESDGSFNIGGLPADLFTFRIVSIDTAVKPIDISGIQLTPGETKNLYAQGGQSMRIILNTSHSGADVSGNVYGFPILVRLNSSNFDFSSAQIDGRDIRFTKPDNTMLPYEIERWDAALQLAEIWVKVDTVYGNDSAQAIMMNWGNSTEISESNSVRVFDSINGFEGVWHLSETSGTVAADASHNDFNGIYRGGLPRSELGPSGICQDILRPDTDYIDIGNVLNPGMKNFAFSVWFKRGTLGTQQALIAKTNGNSPSPEYGYLLNFDSDNFPHIYMATGGTNWYSDSTFNVLSNLAITDTTWHYVFVVIDRSDNVRCKMYLDGIDRTGKTGGDITHISSVSNTLNFRIGTENDNNCSFSGAISEVTFAFTVRSADWVKLCYMNQKELDVLVKW